MLFFFFLCYELNDGSLRLLPGQQAPELPDVPAGPGGLCGAAPEPEEPRAGSPAQPGDRCGRLLRRDALGLVQDEVPQCSCRVGVAAPNSNSPGLFVPLEAPRRLTAHTNLRCIHNTKRHSRIFFFNHF